MKINNVKGKQISFKVVGADQIDRLMEINPERVELFIDEEGALYIVSKGDLDLYELRFGVKKKTQEKIVPNIFLEENQFELF